MPAFQDYIALRLGVAEWVDNRSMSDVIDRFTLEAEAVLNKFIRTRENLTTGATLTFTAGFAPLPSDFEEIAQIWDATLRFPLDGSDRRVTQGTNDLYSYAIDTVNVYIEGLDGATRIMDYYAKLPTLTTSPTTSNWLLQRSPDLYLYAVCVQAAKWMKNSDLAKAAQDLMDMEKLDLFRDDARAKWGNASIRTRAPTP